MKQFYMHRFDRDDMEGSCWTEYVVSSSPTLSSDWRHIPEEEKTVMDWDDNSDIEYFYQGAIKVSG